MFFFLNSRLFNPPTTFVSHGYAVTTYVTNTPTVWTLSDFEESQDTTDEIFSSFGEWASDNIYATDFNYTIPENVRVRLSWRTTNSGNFYTTPMSYSLGRDGFIEAVEKFYAYFIELMQRYSITTFSGQLNVQLAEDLEAGNVLYGGPRTNRIEKIFNEYVVLDHPSTRLCVWKSFYKGRQIQKRPTDSSCLMKGKELNDKTSRFRRQVIEQGFVNSNCERAKEIIQGCVNYCKEVLREKYSVALMNFAFQITDQFGDLKKPEPEIIIRDNGKGHAQLVIKRSFLDRHEAMS